MYIQIGNIKIRPMLNVINKLAKRRKDIPLTISVVNCISHGGLLNHRENKPIQNQ